MKAIGSKIIVKVRKGDDALTEKIGSFTVKVGAGQYESVTVVAFGSDIKDLTVGDEILILPHSGYEWTKEGITYRTISVADIIAVQE